jgi:hypothetical protein
VNKIDIGYKTKTVFQRTGGAKSSFHPPFLSFDSLVEKAEPVPPLSLYPLRSDIKSEIVQEVARTGKLEGICYAGTPFY